MRVAWTCIKCKKEFDNTPNDGTPPHAIATRAKSDGTIVIIGEVCKLCYEKGNK